MPPAPAPAGALLFHLSEIKMLVVAGLSLKNLNPRVWDPESPHYLPQLRAVMVSYADFHRQPRARAAAMEKGLHGWLGIPDGVQVYLDNGAFYFTGRDAEDGASFAEYERFVEAARPDWWPIPRDYIPLPRMSRARQVKCLNETMAVNRAYEHDGFVPVVHIGPHLEEYVGQLEANERLRQKRRLALGAIVPNLLRAPKAMSYESLLKLLTQLTEAVGSRDLHVFGLGGTATLHIAGLLGIDSADSSGWRNRAARGIIQLPGSGDRVAAELGSWRGRRPSRREWRDLSDCECPACERDGKRGLKADATKGFSHRATHNLWVLLKEAEWVSHRLSDGSYPDVYKDRLDNSTYVPLLERIVTAIEAQADASSVDT